MSRLNKGRKIIYLASVALLGGRVIISVTQKSHLHGSLKIFMATAIGLNSEANKISAGSY